MTRGERAVLWLLDAECRLREFAYSLAPTDERHAAWRAAEAKHCRFLNACAGPEPTDPETRDEMPWDEDPSTRVPVPDIANGPSVPWDDTRIWDETRIGDVAVPGVVRIAGTRLVDTVINRSRGMDFHVVDENDDESMVSHVFGPGSER